MNACTDGAMLSETEAEEYGDGRRSTRGSVCTDSGHPIGMQGVTLPCRLSRTLLEARIYGTTDMSILQPSFHRIYTNRVITKSKGDTISFRYIRCFVITINALNCNVYHSGVKILTCK